MNKQLLSSPVESYISEQGLLIPRDWLIGVEKVEIRRKDNMITIIPVEKDDPISKLGTKPVSCGITDGSQEHDQYLNLAEKQTVIGGKLGYDKHFEQAGFEKLP